METDVKQRGILSVLVVLGVLMFLLGGYLTGSFDFRQFVATGDIAERPEFDTDFLYSRAYELYENNDRAMSGDIARRIIYLKPNHKDAHKLLAAIALRDRDFNRAADECKRLIEIDPSDMNAYLGFGTALRRVGQPEKAEKAFRTVASSPLSSEQQREEAFIHLSELGKSTSTKSDRITGGDVSP